MDKKSVEIEKNENSSELVGKVKIKEGTKKKSASKKNTKVDLEQTIALDTVEILRKGNVKSHSEEEKRSELTGKVNSKKKAKSKEASSEVKNKKIKSRKIRFDDVSMEETTDDKTQENVENISLAMIAMMVLFGLVVCFVVGYMLYKIALTNSDSMALIFRGFGL